MNGLYTCLGHSLIIRLSGKRAAMVVLCYAKGVGGRVIRGLFYAGRPLAPARADIGAPSLLRPTAELSVSPPTPDSVNICHGFGCKYRAELALSSADRAALGWYAGGWGKPRLRRERRAIGTAGAWFRPPHRRRSPVPIGHVARADRNYMFDKRQMDCIDSSRNTTSSASCARTAQASAPPRCRRTRRSGLPDRRQAAACHRGTKRKGDRHKMVGGLLDARLCPGAGNHAAGAVEDARLGLRIKTPALARAFGQSVNRSLKA